MTAPTTPYISSKPGDLITADLFNGMQEAIKKDIAAQIATAIAGVKSVANAGDAAKLAGKSVEELTEDILRQALQNLPKRTGYQRLFKRLEIDKEKLIEHKLGACPLVDLYQLDYFDAICSDDEHDSEKMSVNFYLYHSSEKKIRYKDNGNRLTLTIEDIDEHAFKMAFADLLELYHVPYDDETSLGDLVNEFWKALFKDPNDEFDEDQYCHSPWFEKCCGERRTVEVLKERGDWNDLWLKLMPRKTVNHPSVVGQANPEPAPPSIEVVQYDLETIGLRVLPGSHPYATANAPGGRDHLKLMVLLKV